MNLAAAHPVASAGPALWITLLVVLIPAAASIAAAVVAARSAKVAKLREAETERLRDLENRISERKYETYRPMLQMLGDAFNQFKVDKLAADQEINSEKVSDFSTWINVYGSDEAVQAFHNFSVSANYDPPPLITMRLIADFMLAARRDMGYPDTKISGMHLVATRIKDSYDQNEFRLAMTLPFEELCRQLNWNPVWSPSFTSEINAGTK